MNRASARPRSGSMLIELMVVMPIFTTLLVLTIGWIHQSMTLASTIRDRQHHHQHLLLLARQLRDDVHRASDVRLEDPETLVIAWGDASQVTYRLSEHRVVRRWNAAQTNTGDPAQQGPRIGREQYELAAGSRARWQTSERPGWVTLVVERPRGILGGRSATERPATDPPPVTDLHVRAAVGRWRPAATTTASPSPSKTTSASPGETEAQGDSETAGGAAPRSVSGTADTAPGEGR